jgi:hypothetical protein
MKRTREQRQLLICGSRKHQARDDFSRFTRELGRQLIRDTTWRIVTGGYGTVGERLSTVDELVVKGADEVLTKAGTRPQERVLTIVPENSVSNRYFRYGRTIVVSGATPRERRADMVRRADVVLAIGGGSGSAEIIDQAYAADKPLLPLAFTGGAAAEVWERYRALLIRRYSLTTAEIAVIEEGGSNRSILVRRIIGILDRMSVAKVPHTILGKPTRRLKARKIGSRKVKASQPGGTEGKLRLLIASPGDVKKERVIVRKVVDEVNRGVGVDRRIEFQVVAWETDTYPGFHPLGAQALIDDLLRIEDCDVVVGIFWKRFGTPALKSKSGTEHEIRTAVAAWKTRKMPHVMLYFSTKPYSPKDASETKQWTDVLKFRGEFQAKGLLGTYTTQKQFEDTFRDHLTLHVRTKYPIRSGGK